MSSTQKEFIKHLNFQTGSYDDRRMHVSIYNLENFRVGGTSSPSSGPQVVQ